jgi:hypothetical protein
LLTSAAETGATGNKSVVTDWSTDGRTGCVGNSHQMISKGISNVLRLSDKLVMRFNLSKSVIFPSEVGNIFPKLLRLRYKTVIDRLQSTLPVGVNGNYHTLTNN